MLDRETIYQVAILTAAVLLFIGVAGSVSVVYTTNGGISPTGGYALVAAMILFVAVLAAAGIWLDRQDFDGEGA